MELLNGLDQPSRNLLQTQKTVRVEALVHQALFDDRPELLQDLLMRLLLGIQRRQPTLDRQKSHLGIERRLGCYLDFRHLTW